jgi:hypothetical protein
MNARHATVTAEVTADETSSGLCRDDRPGAVQLDRLWFARRLRVGASICRYGVGLEVPQWTRHRPRHPSLSPVTAVHNSS